MLRLPLVNFQKGRGGGGGGRGGRKWKGHLKRSTFLIETAVRGEWVGGDFVE